MIGTPVTLVLPNMTSRGGTVEENDEFFCDGFSLKWPAKRFTIISCPNFVYEG